MIDRDALIERIFNELAGLSPRDRQAYWNASSVESRTVRQEVEELLAFHDRDDGVLDLTPERPGRVLPDLAFPDNGQPSQGPGDVLGPYRIVRLLGKGGMGVVYLAEQRHPVERTVALKIVKRGMDTREVLTRFEAERQALSRMESPYIARILDAGSTPDGLPYFALEYVAGESINEFCDRHRLTVRERLGVFLQVCEGIQHAHQKGIIHRDLKPSNILVTMQGESPMARIIDFGVAKALHVEGRGLTRLTAIGSVVGTPEYMSPEQAGLVPGGVDTRSDIYSLGLVLYKLLTGSHPGDGATAPAAGARSDPVKPSALAWSLDEASDVFRARRTTRAGLAGQLRNELDWIVLKSLEFEPARRLASVSELKSDVVRFLEGETVLAGPPGAGYRLSRFMRRHRVAVLSAAAVFAALIAGVVTSTGFFLREQRARLAAQESARRAEREADKATHVRLFLQEFLLSPSPDVSRGDSLTVREALDRAAVKVDSYHPDDPEVQSDIRGTIASVYASLGHLDAAEKHYRKAVELLRPLDPAKPELLANALWGLAAVLQQGRAQFKEAEAMYVEAASVLESMGAPGLTDLHGVRTHLGNLYLTQRRFREAEAQYRALLEIQPRLFGADHERVASTKCSLANLLIADARYEEADSLLQQSLQARQRLFGEDHAETMNTYGIMSYLQRSLGKYDDAVTFESRLLEFRSRNLGADHFLTRRSQRDLAAALIGKGDFGRAESVLAACLEERPGRPPLPAAEAARARLFRGDVFRATGRPVAARSVYETSLEIYRRIYGFDDHTQVATLLENLGDLDMAAGNVPGAREKYTSALEQRERLLRPDHPHTLSVRRKLESPGTLSTPAPSQEGGAGAHSITGREISPWIARTGN